jgi:hypothetical protein
MIRSASLRRLHFLNALFAPLTGHDLYLAQQIDAAITTSLTDALTDPEDASAIESSDPKFTVAAAELFGRLCAAQTSHGFFHWDAARDNAGSSPLFARAGLMEGLKRVAAYSDSTVLVTNLRSAHCPSDRRWTARRHSEYQETLALLNDLAAARTRRGAKLNLLFL